MNYEQIGERGTYADPGAISLNEYKEIQSNCITDKDESNIDADGILSSSSTACIHGGHDDQVWYKDLEHLKGSNEKR